MLLGFGDKLVESPNPQFYFLLTACNMSEADYSVRYDLVLALRDIETAFVLHFVFLPFLP